MTGFAAAYEGTPPWDIGRPQRAILERADDVLGSVLDVGCGTGEHALAFAARGHEAWGVDAAPVAVEKAKAKAHERGLEAHFEVADVLDLGRLGRTFTALVDVGVFHVFADADRPVYARSLASALVPRGSLHLLCFSEREPGGWGPRRVTERELRASFAAPAWEVESVEAAPFETLDGERQGWLARIRRL
jgi:cyclopropane fatty-acyl-phospholipid synthase-like methyltransferase